MDQRRAKMLETLKAPKSATELNSVLEQLSLYMQDQWPFRTAVEFALIEAMQHEDSVIRDLALKYFAENLIPSTLKSSFMCCFLNGFEPKKALYLGLIEILGEKRHLHDVTLRLYGEVFGDEQFVEDLIRARSER